MNNDNTSQQIKPVTVDIISIFFLLSIRFLAVYGFQWLLLTKFGYEPFSYLETILIYAGIYSLTNNK